MTTPTQLPDPPPIVLATTKKNKTPAWFYLVRGTMLKRFARFECYGWIEAEKLTVVPHPYNSNEAIDIVNQLREASAVKRSSRGRLNKAKAK